MNRKNLTEEVLCERKRGKERDELTRKIGILVYSLLKDKYCMNDDDRSKFFCSFYKKLPGLIDRFEFCGKPFELYLNSTLRWNIKTFRTRESRYTGMFIAVHKKPFYLVSEENSEKDNFLPDLNITDTAKKVLNIEKSNQIIPDAYKSRLFFVYLIECDYLDKRIQDGIIEMIGLNKKWVEDCSLKLKKKVEERVKRVKSIQNRRNSYFLELHILQEKVVFAENEIEKDEIYKKITKLRYSIKRFNKIIAHAMIHPTHREIAEVLNLPKGTVDSGIYYIKNSFKKFESAEQRSA